jgi:hypothetical protein
LGNCGIGAIGEPCDGGQAGEGSERFEDLYLALSTLPPKERSASPCIT